MKIRNGFVSNSSSSSFIIGVAKVADEKKLKQILKKVPKSEKDCYMIGTFDEIANSHLVGRVYRLSHKDDDRLSKIVVEAPINSCETVMVDADNWDRDTIRYVKMNKKGDLYSVEKPAKWFAVCVGNDEGDGGDSPFYQWSKWNHFQYTFIARPLNWLSKHFLYPFIKVANKIFNKSWFYPYMIVDAKSGYDKVKDHTFFKEEWQREIVKAFEEAENTNTRCSNSGVFSDDWCCHTYKIGADRNG